jgi:hypothetical protein
MIALITKRNAVNQQKLVEINLFNVNLSKHQNQQILNAKNVNTSWKVMMNVVDHTAQLVEIRV